MSGGQHQKNPSGIQFDILDMNGPVLLNEVVHSYYE